MARKEILNFQMEATKFQLCKIMHLSYEMDITKTNKQTKSKISHVQLTCFLHGHALKLRFQLCRIPLFHFKYN